MAFESRGVEDSTIEVDCFIAVADNEVRMHGPQTYTLVLRFGTLGYSPPPSNCSLLIALGDRVRVAVWHGGQACGGVVVPTCPTNPANWVTPTQSRVL